MSRCSVRMMISVSEKLASSCIGFFAAGSPEGELRIVEVFISHFLKLSRLLQDIREGKSHVSNRSRIAL